MGSLESAWNIPGYAALVKERELYGSEIPDIVHWDDEQRAKGIMPPGYEGAKLRLRFWRLVNLEASDFTERPALARKLVKRARVGMPPRSRIKKKNEWVTLLGRRDASVEETLDAAWDEFLGVPYTKLNERGFGAYGIEVRTEWYR